MEKWIWCWYDEVSVNSAICVPKTSEFQSGGKCKERCLTPNILYNYGIQNDDLMQNKSPKTPKVGSQNHDSLIFFKQVCHLLGCALCTTRFKNFLDQMSVPKNYISSNFNPIVLKRIVRELELSGSTFYLFQSDWTKIGGDQILYFVTRPILRLLHTN